MSRILAATICAVAFVCICRYAATLIGVEYEDFMFGALAFIHFDLEVRCLKEGGDHA